jgi:hypothetical protein
VNKTNGISIVKSLSNEVSQLSIEEDDSDYEKKDKEFEMMPAYEGGWDPKTESKLEELLMDRLKHLCIETRGKIRDLGYNASDACIALLKQGSCLGSHDVLSNLISSATHQASKGDSEVSNDNLESVQRESLDVLLHALEEKRGSKISRGDALWSLLVCDLDVSKAGQIDVLLSKESTTPCKPEASAVKTEINKSCNTFFFEIL